jgi:hypothetical protein
MRYDHKEDTTGGVTITRLCDGATTYLQHGEDVEIFNASAGKVMDELASLRDGERAERARLRRLYDAICSEYTYEKEGE